MNSFFARIIPFIYLGIVIVILGAGIILLSYLLILGATIGLILFLIVWIKEKIFPSRTLTSTKKTRKSRIIDHDDHLKS